MSGCSHRMSRDSPMLVTLLNGFLVILAVLSLPGARAVWPHPASVELGKSLLQIDASTLEIRPLANGISLNPDLSRAVERAKELIKKASIAPLVVGRGAEKQDEVSKAPTLKVIEIFLGPAAQALYNAGPARNPAEPRDQSPMAAPKDGASAEPIFQTQVQPPTLAQELARDVSALDEGYELIIPSDGSSGALRANSSLGVLHGLTTLAQLVYSLPSSNASESAPSPQLYVDGAPIHIIDRPSFPYRGFMLDVARNFFPLASIKKQLDAMAFVKQNVLHLHLTDAQSWPLELEGELAWMAKEGSYGPGMTYSKADMEELVAYATDRGVMVYPEIDMPGHAATVLRTRNLTVCTDEDDWGKWANEPPSGSLDLKSPAALEWAKKVVRSVLDVFPTSPYFGTGNDEVNLNCYGAKNASDIDAPLLKPFVTGVHGEIDKVAKEENRPLVPTAWEEIILNFPETGKTLLNGTVVQAWTTPDNAAKILSGNPGVRLVHSPSTHFYLDCGRGGWLGNATQDWQFNSWCAYVSWQKMYSFDPYAGLANITDAKHRVLGGEAAAWTETIDSNSIDTVAWPRAAAAAEVFWTGASYTSSSSVTPRSSAEAIARLNDLRYRLVSLGVGAEPIGPHWCALRPGRCNVPLGD